MLNVIAECVAFMFHLQTCVHDEQITVKDCTLLLKAGLLALKPKGVAHSSVVENDDEDVYDRIEGLVQVIKQELVAQQQKNV